MAAGGSYGKMSIKKNGIYHDMPCTIGTMGDIYVYIYIYIYVYVCVCACVRVCKRMLKRMHYYICILI